MNNRAHAFSTTILLLFAAAATPAQERPQGSPQGRGGMGRPIVLGPDDVRAFPDAPEGFNTRRAGVPAGRIDLLAAALDGLGYFYEWRGLFNDGEDA